MKFLTNKEQQVYLYPAALLICYLMKLSESAKISEGIEVAVAIVIAKIVAVAVI